jgi:hypothetical protein
MATDVFNPETSSKRPSNPKAAQPWPKKASQVAIGGAKTLRSAAKSAKGLDLQAQSLKDLAKQGIVCLEQGDIEGAALLFVAVMNATATQRHTALDIFRDTLSVASDLEAALDGKYD